MTLGLPCHDGRQEEVVQVPIDDIGVADSPRIGGVDPEHVDLLASIDDTLPSIVVHRETMRVIDGMHRLAAARERGAEVIDVRFFDGDSDAAFVLAVSLNTTHGLPLSRRERMAAATRILLTRPAWSDRAIASAVGISARTVAELRAGSAASHLTSARRGADGRLRPVDGARGRRAAAEILVTRPELSLRQVAQLAGISPETVRDVKNRLTDGRNPVPDQRRGNPVPVAEEGESPPPAGKQLGGLSAADTSSLVRRLQADRGFRESAAGTALLRIFMAHLAETEMWDRLAQSVPAHCRGTVARLAMECGRIWDTLADGIDGTTEMA